MKPKVQPADEMRMKASDFDRIMRDALGVAPPPVAKKAARKPSTKKKAAK